MKKSLMILAVGAAFGAQGAWAQESTIYGKVYPEIFSLSTSDTTAAGTTGLSDLAGAPTGTTHKGRLGMQASNTYLGIRGNSDLGAGLKAIFQIETQVAADEGNADFLASRDSFGGLEGGFGKIRFGIMDTPHKRYGDMLSFLDISSGNFTSTSNVLRKPGWSGRNNGSRFHERRRNALDYETPNMGGAQFAFQYSFGGEAGASPSTVNTTLEGNKINVISLGGSYKAGPVTVALGYEIHNNLFGASGSATSLAVASLRNSGPTAESKDTATQLAVQYGIGGHTVEFDVIQKKYTETATAATQKFTGYSNNAFQLAYRGRFGATTVAAQFVKSQPGTCTFNVGSCSTSGLDGTQIGIGASQSLSKRTSLFGFMSQIKNGKSATHNNTALTFSPGEDPSILAAGILHRF